MYVFLSKTRVTVEDQKLVLYCYTVCEVFKKKNIITYNKYNIIVT
jgi:hypothetical protein